MPNYGSEAGRVERSDRGSLEPHDLRAGVGGRAVLSEERLEKLVPIFPIAPLIYRTDDVELLVTEQKLVLRARKPTADCLKQIENMAVRVLKKLDDTPISGIGVNFGFVETSPQTDLLNLLNCGDDTQIGVLGWNIEKRSLIRNLQRDDGTLNLTLSCTPSEVEIHANFHHAVSSATDAVSAVEGQVINYHEEVKNLLSEVYELQIDTET